jgi:predicted Holliday junction resolvase-like endonuclease
MFSVGSITFNQLNILFLAALIIAVIFLLIIIIQIVSKGRLKRAYKELYEKTRRQEKSLQESQKMSEESMKELETRVLTKILELLEGIEAS